MSAGRPRCLEVRRAHLQPEHVKHPAGMGVASPLGLASGLEAPLVAGDRDSLRAVASGAVASSAGRSLARTDIAFQPFGRSNVRGVCSLCM